MFQMETRSRTRQIRKKRVKMALQTIREEYQIWSSHKKLRSILLIKDCSIISMLLEGEALEKCGKLNSRETKKFMP